jgi:hypothetical protein
MGTSVERRFKTVHEHFHMRTQFRCSASFPWTSKFRFAHALGFMARASTKLRGELRDRLGKLMQRVAPEPESLGAHNEQEIGSVH